MIIDRVVRFAKEMPKVESALETIETVFNQHDQGRSAWNALCLVPTVVTSGSSYAMDRNETWVVVNKTVGSATTVTLVASPIAGHVAVVKDGKGDAGANNITIQSASGTIDGAASKAIGSNFGSMVFGYNGTEWNVLSAS